MKNKIIVGIVGEMAAGKTVVTNHLKEKYGAVSFRFSDMLRDVLDRLHLDHSRINMQTLSTVLRKNFGEDLMSKVLAQDVAASNANIVITEGIRRPSDITYLREMKGFLLIYLSVDERTRYERIILRSENPDDRRKTWEQFQQEGRQESEQKIKEIAAQAEYVIDNNGSLEETLKNLDVLMKRVCE